MFVNQTQRDAILDNCIRATNNAYKTEFLTAYNDYDNCLLRIKYQRDAKSNVLKLA